MRDTRSSGGSGGDRSYDPPRNGFAPSDPSVIGLKAPRSSFSSSEEQGPCAVRTRELLDPMKVGCTVGVDEPDSLSFRRMGGPRPSPYLGVPASQHNRKEGPRV